MYSEIQNVFSRAKLFNPDVHGRTLHTLPVACTRIPPKHCFLAVFLLFALRTQNIFGNSLVAQATRCPVRRLSDARGTRA